MRVIYACTLVAQRSLDLWGWSLEIPQAQAGREEIEGVRGGDGAMGRPRY